MFVVPLTGDIVETEGGVKQTVLSYAAYKNQPAVYVESDGARSEHVLFSDIKKINGTPVSLTPGKVFKADSLVKRKAQLPQEGDKIAAGGETYKVKTLKLRFQNKLTDGMSIACVTELKEEVPVRLAVIDSITRADGDTDSVRAILSVYREYLGRV
jgi:hypothetical protein